MGKYNIQGCQSRWKKNRLAFRIALKLTCAFLPTTSICMKTFKERRAHFITFIWFCCSFLRSMTSCCCILLYMRRWTLLNRHTNKIELRKAMSLIRWHRNRLPLCSANHQMQFKFVAFVLHIISANENTQTVWALETKEKKQQFERKIKLTNLHFQMNCVLFIFLWRWNVLA